MVERLYQALGLTSSATIVEVKKAYRNLAKEYHPDKNKDGAEKFKEISNAYSILCDPEKLAEYKRKQSIQREPSGGGYSHMDTDFGGFYDFTGFGPNFEDFFGKYAPPPRQQKPQRTNFDIKEDATITLEDVYNGNTVRLNYTEFVDCDECHNDKREPKLRRFKTCEKCKGKGEFQRNDDRKMHRPIRCPYCQGQGKLRYFVECKKCRNVRTQQKKVIIKVPKGIHTGHGLQVKGRGYKKPKDDSRGNLTFRVHIADHPIFRREGDNLHIKVCLSLKEALFGFQNKKMCTHLDGRKITASEQSGTTIKPKSQRKIPGEGMPVYGSQKDARGDLIITFEVEWPDKIQIPQSPEAKNVIDALFETEEEKNIRENAIVIEDDDEDETMADDSAAPESFKGSEKKAPVQETHKVLEEVLPGDVPNSEEEEEEYHSPDQYYSEEEEPENLHFGSEGFASFFTSFF